MYPSYEINGQFWQDEIVSDWFVDISDDYEKMMDSGEYESVEAIEVCANELYRLLREGIWKGHY